MDVTVKVGIKTLIPLVLIITFMAGLASLGADVWMVLSVGIWGVLIVNCLKNMEQNGFFLFFLLSFFVFLMSGDIAEMLFDKHYYLQFEKEVTVHAHKCLCISMVAMWIGYVLTKVKKPQKDKSINRIDGLNETVYNIGQFTKWIYAASYMLILVNTVDAVRFVASYGYIAYYTSYDPILPSILTELGEFTPLILCAYLATFPTKKESSLIVKSFLLYSVLTLFIGTRSGIVYNTAFIICYCLYRNYTDKGKEVWISRRMIGILLLLVPFLLVFLYVYEYIRTGRDIVFTTFGETIVDFFVNIGASSKVIKYGYEYAEYIPKWKFYSLGETLNYFKYGTLFNLFDLSSIPARHTATFAMESHSLGNLISYLVMPQKYLGGHGTGSSFVAELYADFGYIGVAVGSAIYGWIFKKISYLSDKYWLSTTIKLFVFFTMLSAPRGSFDGFIAAVLNINNIMCIALVYLLVHSLSDRARMR